MPWKTSTTMSERKEFIKFATADGANIRELCRRYKISPKTGYKWLKRFKLGGEKGLIDQSRVPHNTPKRTVEAMETAILGVRDLHPAWGARTIKRRLMNLGHQNIPSPSTITAVLRREGRLVLEESKKHTAWQRFEAEAPNMLWQMDFKGHFLMMNNERCHPLTILDDHSRFSLGIFAGPGETEQLVREYLTKAFRTYGLPMRMLMDNGSPWGTGRNYRYTALTVWLLQLGIAVSHTRVCHPQTNGKDERFHRTLQIEAIGRRTFADCNDCQRQFDHWRNIYNLERPHHALNMDVPASRYRLSQRAFPEQLPSIEYGVHDIVRKVQGKGEVNFSNREFIVGKAFRGYPVAVRPTLTDGVYDVYFCHQKISQINLNPVSSH